MKIFNNHKIFLTFFVLFGILSVCFYIFAAPGDPANPGSDFTVCTDGEDQPSCYGGESPTPVLDWTFSSPGGVSSQQAYWIQVDDDGNEWGDFPSPEVNVQVNSGATQYSVSSGNLDFNTSYYWKVAVRDEHGSWNDWAVSDDAFTTNNYCNIDPTATSLSVSAPSSGSYCSGPSHHFSWVYLDADDDDESQFRFQVDDSSTFNSPEVDRTQSSGWSSGSTNNQVVSVSTSPSSGEIEYHETYYWRVRVWDDRGGDSGWIEGSSFFTAQHPYPDVDFTWNPDEPSAEEAVQFNNNSNAYGGSSISSFSWSFEDASPSSSSSENPMVQFNSHGLKNVNLQVTDSDGYSCDVTRVIDVQFALPDWKEVFPW